MANSELQIYLFGQLRLFVGKRPFPLKTLPKTKSLLAYLLLHRDNPIPRDQLAFTLWPDASEKQAKSRLRRHLYDLRQALPPFPEDIPWLLVTPKTVQWHTTAFYWLDVAAFTHLSQNGRLAEATAIYTGPLLSDLDEPWLPAPRQNLQTQFITALSHLVTMQWRAGDWRQAAFYAQQTITEDPFNETIVQQRLALLYGLGERATAVSQFQHFKQALADEFGIAPLPETTAVFNAIQQNKPIDDTFALAGLAKPSASPAVPQATRQSPVQHTLPTPLRPLIGRQQVQRQLVQLLASKTPSRLLTLTGTGGIGKTRLAIAVAQQLHQHQAHRFPDGFFFMPLAALQKPEQVLTAVANTLNIQPKGQTSLLQTLQEQLRYQQCLLILDNFEHLLPAAIQLHALLQTASQLQLLVTSRTPLNLVGEQEFPVPALALPEPQSELGLLQQTESVLFFTAVAQATNPHFRVTDENGTAVAQLCHQLDGLPLAIELAAARSKHFPPDILLKQLHQNHTLLTTQDQTVPDRHRSLTAALQWSYDLLSEAEQRLLAQLSLFEESFSVTAVAFACLNKPFIDITHIDPETLNALTSLSNKSLIYPTSQNRVEGELRFAMLSVVRTFASQRLDATEAARLKVQLLHYFSQWHEPLWLSAGKPAEATWTHHFQVEYKTLVNVMAYGQALSDPPIEVIKAIGHIACFYKKWESVGNLKTALANIAWVLTYKTRLPTKSLHRIHFSAASLAAANGDYALATSHTDACQTYARQLEDYPALVTALELASTLYNRQEQPEKALILLREAEAVLDDETKEIARREYFRAGIHANIGITHYFLGDYAEAERFLLLQLDYDMAQGDLVNVGHGTLNLGEVAMVVAEYEKAENYYRQSLAARRQAREWLGVMQCVGAFAKLAFARAQWNRCIALQSAAINWNQKQNYQAPPFALRETQEMLDQCRAELGEQAYQMAWRNGRNLTLEQAIALAQTETP